MQESTKKMEKIKDIIENNQKIEENKKNILLKKLEEAEERKIEKQR